VHHIQDLPVSRRVRQLLNVIAAALALLTVVGMVVLRPTGGADRPDLAEFGVGSTFYDGGVQAVDREPCAGTAPRAGIDCDIVTVELLQGPDRGDTVELEFPISASNPEFSEGDKIVLNYDPRAGPGFEYQFSDRQRKPVLAWLAVVFALAVVLLGRLRGLAALGGLIASLSVLLLFALPALIDGREAIAVAVVAAAAIAYFALYLAHGFTAMTTVALLGTLGSLALTAVLALVFDGLARFSGFATEEAGFLAATAATIDVRGLLLAGVVIGALGAIDDMTVTQASAVAELHAANPSLGTPGLVRSGLRIGRDHVASTVNTLVLAYVGASMPLFVLFVLSEQSLASVANSEVVAVEIVRTLVGSIGLVASVPLTTWLAARSIRT
jgi:uncharacterized membrane protein